MVLVSILIALGLVAVSVAVDYKFRRVPRFLDRWAEDRGWRLLERRWLGANTGSLDHGHALRGTLYRIVLRDDDGRLRRATACVAHPLHPRPWLIEVRWDAFNEPGYDGPITSSSEPPRADDGPMSRRTILRFAVADLILSFPVVAIGLASLFIFALCLDEACDGALGLNRLVGRTARTYPGDLPTALMMCLGFASLYLSMGGAMIAGGVGMLRRRRWGYACHLVGSGLFVLTIFGVVYTVIALPFALRPGFKEFFERPKGIADDLDPMGDFRASSM